VEIEQFTTESYPVHQRAHVWREALKPHKLYPAIAVPTAVPLYGLLTAGRTAVSRVNQDENSASIRMRTGVGGGGGGGGRRPPPPPPPPRAEESPRHRGALSVVAVDRV
jgi:hypothetical protein